MKNNRFLIIVLIPLLVLFMEQVAAQDDGLDRDFQMWNALRLSVPIGEKWSVNMQNEVRLADDVSSLDEYIFKLYAHHKFSKKFGLSFGYKFIDRPNSYNESDYWAEAVFPRSANKWLLSHQIRFEARDIQTISGILPRIRYLFNWSRQLGDSFMYATGFGAVRFNLADKGTGPNAGFEQIRLNANLGFHLGEVTRFELGYLYRYEVIRDGANFSDNVLHVNLFFTLKRKSRKPLPNDHIL
jgi:hypothetical protein